jgi:VCBS repeat-containing protein
MPAAGGTGSTYSTFTFSVGDGTTTSSTATQTVNVTPVAPTTSNHTVSCPEGSTYTFATSDFPFTDPDSDGESLLTVTIESLPGAGRLNLNGAPVTVREVITAAEITSGELVFTPAAGAYGNPYASFTFSVSDGTASSGTATESVIVTPTPVVAQPDAGAVNQGATLTVAATGVLANDSGNTLTVTQVQQGSRAIAVTAGTPGVITSSYGTLTLHSDGSYSYVANGPASLALATGQTATDGQGGTASTTLTIAITGQSSLSSCVFADNNNDGLLDGPDQGIAGVVVTLKDSRGAVVATTTTGPSGTYSFTLLPAGASLSRPRPTVSRASPTSPSP